MFQNLAAQFDVKQGFAEWFEDFDRLEKGELDRREMAKDALAGMQANDGREDFLPGLPADQTDQGSAMSSKVSKLERKLPSQLANKNLSRAKAVQEESSGDEDIGIIQYHLNELAVYKEPDSDRSNESGSEDYSDGSVQVSDDSDLYRLQLMKSEKMAKE